MPVCLIGLCQFEKAGKELKDFQKEWKTKGPHNDTRQYMHHGFGERNSKDLRTATKFVLSSFNENNEQILDYWLCV